MRSDMELASYHSMVIPDVLIHPGWLYHVGTQAMTFSSNSFIFSKQQLFCVWYEYCVWVKMFCACKLFCHLSPLMIMTCLFMQNSLLTTLGVCPKPGGELYFTRIRFKGPYRTGDQVTYSCHDGGSGTITCLKNGTWAREQLPPCFGQSPALHFVLIYWTLLKHVHNQKCNIYSSSVIQNQLTSQQKSLMTRNKNQQIWLLSGLGLELEFLLFCSLLSQWFSVSRGQSSTL